MGEAKKRNDRMQEHVGVILRNRNEVLDKFTQAYLASVAASPEEQADLAANPSKWIAENVEMVDVTDTSQHGKIGHVVFFRKRTPHPDEIRDMLADMAAVVRSAETMVVDLEAAGQPLENYKLACDRIDRARAHFRRWRITI